MVHIDMNTRVDTHVQNRPEYRFYFALVFPFSVVAAIARRILPGGRRSMTRRRRNISVLAEAMEISRGVVPWVFMGR